MSHAQEAGFDHMTGRSAQIWQGPFISPLEETCTATFSSDTLSVDTVLRGYSSGPAIEKTYLAP